MITDLISPAALAVIALLIIPAVVGLINMLRAVGLPTRWAGPVAVAIGLTVMLAYGLWGDQPLFVYALLGILVGLGAAGFYDLAKLMAPGAARDHIANTHPTNLRVDMDASRNIRPAASESE